MLFESFDVVQEVVELCSIHLSDGDRRVGEPYRQMSRIFLRQREDNVRGIRYS